MNQHPSATWEGVEIPFGFLKEKVSVEFDGGRISPVAEHDSLKAAIFGPDSPHQGFIYPPTMQRVQGPESTPISGSEHPAHMFSVAASHVLTLKEPKSIEDIELQDAAFLVFLLSYIFGRWLYLSKWWFDQRIPKNRNHDFAVANELTLSDFLSRCYRSWRSWKPMSQKLMIHALSMHARGSSYTWDWEKFMANYMVFDALSRVLRLLNRSLKHSGGHVIPKIFCNYLDVEFDEKTMKKFQKQRGALIHQATWGNTLPGFEHTEEAYELGRRLRMMNCRLIPTILGYRNRYTASSWSRGGLGTKHFDMMAPDGNDGALSSEIPEAK